MYCYMINVVAIFSPSLTLNNYPFFLVVGIIFSLLAKFQQIKVLNTVTPLDKCCLKSII